MGRVRDVLLPLLLAAACSSHGQLAPQEPKPGVRYALTPRTCLVPCKATLRISVYAPAPAGALACPGIAVLWGDEAGTRGDPQCSPETTRAPARWHSPPLRHTFRSRGRHVVRMVLFDPVSYDVLARGQAAVVVR
jgi:hypothetical protein